uniref:Alternative protein UBR4 n=1 Tax=Homo sapiens TaxID=9606 RepID=L0R6T5_HUMAN|nr:alternative protein UBR4 [Homo sapiens]
MMMTMMMQMRKCSHQGSRMVVTSVRKARNRVRWTMEILRWCLSRWSWRQLKMSTMATPLPWRPCWQAQRASPPCWTSHLMQMTRPWLN